MSEDSSRNESAQRVWDTLLTIALVAIGVAGIAIGLIVLRGYRNLHLRGGAGEWLWGFLGISQLIVLMVVVVVLGVADWWSEGQSPPRSRKRDNQGADSP